MRRLDAYSILHNSFDNTKESRKMNGGPIIVFALFCHYQHKLYVPVFFRQSCETTVAVAVASAALPHAEIRMEMMLQVHRDSVQLFPFTNHLMNWGITTHQ